MKDTTLNDQYESKFTLRNIGKAIAKFKWWVIGVSIVGIVAGYLIFSLAVNPPREKLVSTFGYNINVSQNLDEDGKAVNGDKTEYFADGSIFNFTDIVSEERMAAVKAENPGKFDNIDPTAFYKNGSISISKKSYVNSQTGETVYLEPATYVITASKKAFASESQGKEFIFALIDKTRLVAAEANDRFQIENCIYETTKVSYINYLTQLQDQYNAILGTYDELQENFAYSTKVSDTLALGDAKKEFLNKFADSSNTIISTLQGDLVGKHIVDYTVDTAASLKSKGDGYIQNLYPLFNTLTTYQNSLDDIKSSSATMEPQSEIAKLVVELTKKITSTQTSINSLVSELQYLGYTIPANLSKETIKNITFDPSGEGAIQSITASTDAWKSECDAFKQKINKSFCHPIFILEWDM